WGEWDGQALPHGQAVGISDAVLAHDFRYELLGGIIGKGVAPDQDQKEMFSRPDGVDAAPRGLACLGEYFYCRYPGSFTLPGVLLRLGRRQLHQIDLEAILSGHAGTVLCLWGRQLLQV